MIIPEELLELKQMVHDVFKKDVAPHVAKYDVSGEHPTELYDICFELGLHAMSVPEEYGGSGLDTFAKVILLEEIAYWDNGLASAMGANMLSIETVRRIGTPEQHKIYFDIIAGGQLGAFCLTEPNAGSDAGSIRTTAVLDGDEYVLNGSKCFITNGGIAGVYTVVAVTDKTKGSKGISVFICEADRPGISTGKKEDKMGIRLSNTTDVVFQDVRIPKEYMLGSEGEGFRSTMETFNVCRLPVASQSVGIAQRALDEALKYAKERVQFGKPIAQQQMIQQILADMAIGIESARQLTYHATDLCCRDLPFARYAAMAKARASDVAMECTTQGVQIFGGYGYMREFPMEKLMRDAKIMQIYEGTSQIQRLIIARDLLK